MFLGNSSAWAPGVGKMGINVTKATQRVFVLNKEKRREREREGEGKIYINKLDTRRQERRGGSLSFSNWSTSILGTGKCKREGRGLGGESLCLPWGPVGGTGSMCPGVTLEK